METVNSENKSETSKKEGATSLKDLEKQMRFVTFLILMGVVWIKWLRYIVLWCTVALGIWWITLPVFFFWTINYWYLKMFGTIPFITFGFYIFIHGINETLKYSSKNKREENISNNTEIIKEEIKNKIINGKQNNITNESES